MQGELLYYVVPRTAPEFASGEKEVQHFGPTRLADR